MTQGTQVLRPNAGVRALCGVIYLAGVVLLSVRLPFGISEHHRVWIVPVFALLGAFWLADATTTRIVLGPDCIRIFSISDLQSRTIPRATIESVTWEKVCGVSILLRGGEWVRLPSIGRDPKGVTNTVRAWLAATEVL